MVVTSAYARPYTLWGEGRESGVSQSGVGGGGRMLHFLGGKSCDAFVQPADFLGRKSRKKWRGHCRRIQELIYFRYLFQVVFKYFIAQGFSDRSAQFL